MCCYSASRTNQKHPFHRDFLIYAAGQRHTNNGRNGTECLINHKGGPRDPQFLRDRCNKQRVEVRQQARRCCCQKHTGKYDYPTIEEFLFHLYQPRITGTCQPHPPANSRTFLCPYCRQPPHWTVIVSAHLRNRRPLHRQAARRRCLCPHASSGCR